MSLSGTIRRGMWDRYGMQGMGLDYLTGAEQIPRGYREGAIRTLGGLAGITPEAPRAQDLLSGITGDRDVMRIIESQPDIRNLVRSLLSGDIPEGQSVDDLIEGLDIATTKDKYRRRAKERLKGSGEFRDMLSDIMEGRYEAQDPAEIQQQQIDLAKSSPLYEELRRGGEEATMRQASATGGLRSGNVQDALWRAQNNALLQSYGQQIAPLSGLTGLQSYAPQIAGMYGRMGEGLYEGWLGSGLAREATRGPSTMQTLGGFAGAGLGAYFGGPAGAQAGGQIGTQLGGLF